MKTLLKKLILTATLTALLMSGCSKAMDSVLDNTILSDDIRATQVSSFGSNPGALAMYKYVPAGMSSNAALVVALHGCTQDAATYESNTGWNKLADTYKFYVVYAQQSSSNNSSKCFNWFESGDISRNSGEALSIKQMVDNMKSSYSIDASKVFVTGLSAGGYFTPVMLAAYPDVFAAGAVMAGGPYKCATSMTDAFTCMSPGKTDTAANWGAKVKGAYTSFTGTYPRVSIFHGATDTTVKPVNMDELVKQWTYVHGADQTADVSDTVKGHPHKVYKNSSGVAVVETYSITGMGHAISVDPGTGAEQGGTTGSYSIDKDLYSSYWAAKFFGIIGGTTSSSISSSVSSSVVSSVSSSSVAACITTTASNYAHVTAGRAINSLGTAKAKGSLESLGLYNTFTTTTVATRDGVTYWKDTCK